MEKFSQYRDRGTQIAPFLPIRGTRTPLQRVYGVLLFVLRLPFFVSLLASYCLVVHWLPVGSLIRKGWLWSILGVCGVWWVDLQVEGVKRGSLAKARSRLPGTGSVIVSTYTSPLDAIYLAAVFDPVFTISYPATTLVARVPLPVFLYRIFFPPTLTPPTGASLASLSALLSDPKTHNRPILLFPESTPTNGRGVLRFTPALTTVPPATPIFPVSLKYTPADVTTPLPGSYIAFTWAILSGATHCVRVRIAEAIRNEKGVTADGGFGGKDSAEEAVRWALGEGGEEPDVCAKGAEALARIGRVKRLNLGVREKIGFCEAWGKNRRR